MATRKPGLRPSCSFRAAQTFLNCNLDALKCRASARLPSLVITSSAYLLARFKEQTCVTPKEVHDGGDAIHGTLLGSQGCSRFSALQMCLKLLRVCFARRGNFTGDFCKLQLLCNNKNHMRLAKQKGGSNSKYDSKNHVSALEGTVRNDN